MSLQPKANVRLQNEQAALTFRHLALLALLMICALAVVGQLYVTIPLTGTIATGFGVEPAQAALVGTVFGLAYASGFLVFGWMSDRHGRKRMILIGLAAMTVATVLVGLAQGFAALLAARAAQGLAASIFPPAALSLVAEALPPRHRPLGVSLMSLAFLGAVPLAQLFATQVEGGLSGVMYRLAPLYALGAAGLFFAAVPRQVTQSAAQPARPLLRDPGMIAAWGAAPTVLFAFVSFYGGAQALGAQAGGGIDLQTLRLAGLPPLLLAFAAAPLTRRFGASVTARLGLVLAAAALAIAALAPAAALTPASALLAGGVALAVPGLIATVAGRAADANRGHALAVYSFALFLGASLAPPAAQTLAGNGPLALWLLPAALLLAAALGLTAGIRPTQIPDRN